MHNYTDNDIDEDMKLTRRDYIKILHHYQPKKVVSGSTKTIKERAHRILADKLCRCIKTSAAATTTTTTTPRDESRRIAYCSRSIFNNRGLRQHGFSCKTTTTKNGRGNGKFSKDITKTRRILRL